MKTKHPIPFYILCCTLAFSVLSCTVSTTRPRSKEEVVGSIQTRAVRTALASMLTRTAEATSGALNIPAATIEPGKSALLPMVNFQTGATMVPTTTLIIPTVAILPPTITPTFTNTPIPPTSTPIPPTSTPNICYLAQFIQDINYPDGFSVSPKQKFSKIWRVKNAGSCPWDPSMVLINVAGETFKAKNTALPSVVLPGAYVDLIIEMTAPDSTGMHYSSWMIKTLDGHVFGAGPVGTNYLFVRINVSNTTGTASASTAAASTSTTAPTSTTAATSTTASSTSTTTSSTSTPSNTYTPSPSPTMGPPPR